MPRMQGVHQRLYRNAARGAHDPWPALARIRREASGLWVSESDGRELEQIGSLSAWAPHLTPHLNLEAGGSDDYGAPIWRASKLKLIDSSPEALTRWNLLSLGGQAPDPECAQSARGLALEGNCAVYESGSLQAPDHSWAEAQREWAEGGHQPLSLRQWTHDTQATLSWKSFTERERQWLAFEHRLSLWLIERVSGQGPWPHWVLSALRQCALRMLPQLLWPEEERDAWHASFAAAWRVWQLLEEPRDTDPRAALTERALLTNLAQCAGTLTSRIGRHQGAYATLNFWWSSRESRARLVSLDATEAGIPGEISAVVAPDWCALLGDQDSWIHVQSDPPGWMLRAARRLTPQGTLQRETAERLLQWGARSILGPRDLRSHDGRWPDARWAQISDEMRSPGVREHAGDAAHVQKITLT